MTDQPHLMPREGLSNFHIEFDGLDAIRGTGDAVVRFRIVIGDRVDEDVAELEFRVDAGDGGVAGLVRRGYDDLINALRQMLYEADTQRSGYKTEAPE